MEQVREMGSMTSSKLALSILYCPAIMVPKTVTKVNDKHDKSSIDVLTLGDLGWSVQILPSISSITMSVGFNCWSLALRKQPWLPRF